MLHIFFITKSVYFYFILICRVTVKDAVLDGVPNLPCIVAMSDYEKRTVIFSKCVATSLNGFIKHGKCMSSKQKWYATLSFGVWMLMIHTIITWTQFNSVINFRMFTNFITRCVSTSCGGIFSFGDTASSLWMCTSFTKQSMKRERWSPWVIMSFDLWFDWQRLTPQNSAAAIIWFHWFKTEE